MPLRQFIHTAFVVSDEEKKIIFGRMLDFLKFSSLCSILEGAMTLSIMTFSIMTLGIRGLYVTLSIGDSQHK